MMVGGLGNLGDLLHELDAVQEFFEPERLADRVALVFPSGKRLQLLRDLLRTELGHLEILRMPPVATAGPHPSPAHPVRKRSGVVPVARACGKRCAGRSKRTQGTLKRRWRTNTLPTKLASRSARSPNRGLTTSSVARSAASPRRSKIAIRSSTANATRARPASAA